MLYQNDDFGKAYLAGFKEGLGDRAAKMIVMEAAYDSTDPTVDSQIVSLQASGADVLFTAAIPKTAAQAIRKVYDIGWKPLHFMYFGGRSIPTVLKSGAPRFADPKQYPWTLSIAPGYDDEARVYMPPIATKNGEPLKRRRRARSRRRAAARERQAPVEGPRAASGVAGGAFCRR